MKLIVTSSFAGHKVGAEITDKAEIQKILKSENAAYVVKANGGADAKPTEKPSTTGDKA